MPTEWVEFTNDDDRIAAINTYSPWVRDALLAFMHKPKNPPVTISARLTNEDALRFARLKARTKLKVNDLIKAALWALEEILDSEKKEISS